ncbi:hypothetical protein K9B35_01315 [Sphingomonas sp. R647]|uniref:hypothetical protein n=1 Tax=Sphingomonas sp. R647 TaxID=2875233 RepID=UPI001CD22082|nr:hypothetical protein [Sphingomonas sp. R647]MCA1196597.1 hypothetical protein [Sphingomonas sp. R647]
MTTLENWYLRRFTPAEDGFTFTQWGYDVRLSRVEVAELLGEWRRVWLSPYLWGGWLLLGVALPILLSVRGSSVPAFMVALLFGVIMVVTLVYTHCRVNSLAQPRVPIEVAQAFGSSQPRWPAAIPLLFWGAQCLAEAEGLWLVAWGLFVALNATIVLRGLWRWARSALAAQPPQ